MKPTIRWITMMLCVLMLAGTLPGCSLIQRAASHKTTLEGGAAPAPDGAGTEGLSAQVLLEHLEELGYTSPIFKWMDIADTAGDELLCLCRHNDAWTLIVIGFVDNAAKTIYTLSLRDQACYIVYVAQVPHLCIYRQSVDTVDGKPYNRYGYQIFRFDSSLELVEADAKSVEYYQDTENAAQTAAFFEAFSGYVSDLMVLRDPFGVTGEYWIAEDQVDFGALPEESTQEDQQQEQGKAGYVSIKYADSWLHLRTGPGTNYDKVLLDPSDPKSFVRQAKGSPVTVLETVETGDKDNPVWVKIKIIYADRELVGYSSKKYITIYGE